MEDMCFSLLKFKMRIDKKLNPWLLKVKPLLAKDLKKEDLIHHQVIQDTLKLIFMTSDSKLQKMDISDERDLVRAREMKNVYYNE